MSPVLSKKININETALLVIDVINSCCHKKCEIKKWGITFKKIRKMVSCLKDFISVYRNAGGNVVFVNRVPWKKEFLTNNLNELYKDPDARYYSRDKSGFAEKFYEVKPEKNDFIVTKNTYDAFTNPKLNKFLKKKKIKYVIVTGVFGEGCVHATIQGGFSAGYNFIILKDLIETADVKRRQIMQHLLKNYNLPYMYGKTVESKNFFELVK